ncbi:SagB-type dehydrogenase family enzyme [Brevibacillus sp. AG162]|uniref:SagB family peptide dehydrogenase n=1 Tax=Brevibacillus sp. AG162 TaxID=2572910 RepID=UPI0011507D76|nr:SagB family peptide dehydrogenase [Brevibacillus sp. AG162]TQK63766.1 SagB-type dehydrogenase family enzyme [Brevibacillus sp. AG162]
MSLENFLYRLHFDTENARPSDLEVDWEDAPLTYKLYRGLPVIPLPEDVPLSLIDQTVSQEMSLPQLGAWLWYSYGLIQISQSLLTTIPGDAGSESFLPLVTNRRPVPSGGGLYPSELYVYLKLSSIPAGLYHYDVAHHRLVRLREGNFDDVLSRALGGHCPVHACFGVAFVSIYFWKNFFKYDEFSYRLQGLDAGVLLGQLQEMANQLGVTNAVHYQFLDRAMNALLGLSVDQESVYAVVPLSLQTEGERHSHSPAHWAERGEETASELIRELPEQKHVHVMRSKRMRQYPVLLRMNEAAMQESPHSFTSYSDHLENKWTRRSEERILLPRLEKPSYDLAQFSRERFSPEMDFIRRKTGRDQVARIMEMAMSVLSYGNDLGKNQEVAWRRLSLLVSIHQVEGIQDGAYAYEPLEHALYPIVYGDLRARLQDGMTLDNVNLYQVPLCFHVAGKRDHLINQLGFRGYRIQQMEAGIVVHRLLLAAFTCGMGGHPLLGFDVKNCDDLYNLETEEKTCLIQIPVGHYRPRARFQGGLHG